MTLGSITRRLKLQKAAGLLQNQALTVSQVAQTVGYVDMSTFYTAFKQYYKMNPAEFRRAHFGS